MKQKIRVGTSDYFSWLYNEIIKQSIRKQSDIKYHFNLIAPPIRINGTNPKFLSKTTAA